MTDTTLWLSKWGGQPEDVDMDANIAESVELGTLFVAEILRSRMTVSTIDDHDGVTEFVPRHVEIQDMVPLSNQGRCPRRCVNKTSEAIIRYHASNELSGDTNRKITTRLLGIINSSPK